MSTAPDGRRVRVVGLQSGTSADAVDAVLLEVAPGAQSRGGGAGGDRAREPQAAAALPRVRLLHYLERPFPDHARDRILAVAENRGRTRDVAILRRDLATWFAEATRALLEEAGLEPRSVAVSGCHGQTVWHEPGGDGDGTSLQLVDPARLAALTGIPVVSDVRAADLAAGGQGAPLVPWSDRILFGSPGEALALQNLGGMGNVTWLPPRGSAAEPLAFDTGPANALMDACAALATGGLARFDADGALAAAGEVDTELRDRILADPFFQRPPPRSTGREVFGSPLVEALARERGLVPGALATAPDGSARRRWSDLMATLADVTVESVALSVERWLLPRGVDRMVLTGGGADNPVLVEGIRSRLEPLPVETGARALGMDPRAREAACFALLGWAFLAGIPGNLPGCTGAAGPRILGSWTPAPGRGGLPEAGP